VRRFLLLALGLVGIVGCSRSISPGPSEDCLRHREQRIAELREQARKNPTDPAPHVALGRIWLDERNYDGARAEFLIVLKLKPGDLESENRVARTFLAQHRWSDGERHARNALKKSQGNVQALAMLGEAMVNLGRREEAVVTLENAVKLAAAAVDKTREAVKKDPASIEAARIHYGACADMELASYNLKTAYFLSYLQLQKKGDAQKAEAFYALSDQASRRADDAEYRADKARCKLENLICPSSCEAPVVEAPKKKTAS